MKILPANIPQLDAAWTPIKGSGFQRKSCEDLGWAERDYDALIVRGHEVLTEMLRQAGKIGPSSTLKVLAPLDPNPHDDDPDKEVKRRQFRAIDVLLAEVEVERDQERFVRLVIVEDKLLGNADSRRKVFAQILEYALRFEELEDDELDSLPEAHREWTAKYREAILSSVRLRDFLLLICGDEIDESLLDLVSRFVARQGHTDLTELVLVELAIYSNGVAHLFLPHLVGETKVVGRDLVLRVEVNDRHGAVAVKNLSVDENPSKAPTKPGSRTPAEYWAKWGADNGPQGVVAWKGLVESMEQAGIPGLYTDHLGNGAPIIGLRGTRIGDVRFLRLKDSGPRISDYCKTGTSWDSIEGSQARSRFREALRRVGFQDMGTQGRVDAPISAAIEHRTELVAAARQLAADLGGGAVT